MATATATAEPVTLSGITFSDELGGFEIVDGRGSGTLGDPFVIVERIVTSQPTVLLVRGLTLEFGNAARTNHFSGFWLTKVAVNHSDQTWTGYRLELEDELGTASPRLDGLSFGQSQPPVQRNFTADRFASMTVLDEPHDGIAFSRGAVPPGDRVAFTVVITHNGPSEEFFLVQRHEQSVAEVPEAGTEPL